jgi:hypothetical protein
VNGRSPHCTAVARTVTVHYRWHPLNGRTLRVLRRQPGKSGVQFFYEHEDGPRGAIPEWMTDSAACSMMALGSPVVANAGAFYQVLEPLRLYCKVRNLLDAHSTSWPANPTARPPMLRAGYRSEPSSRFEPVDPRREGRTGRIYPPMAGRAPARATLSHSNPADLARWLHFNFPRSSKYARKRSWSADYLEPRRRRERRMQRVRSNDEGT